MSERRQELEAARQEVRNRKDAYHRVWGTELEHRRWALVEQAEAKVRDLEEELGIPLQERIDWLKTELARCRHFPPGQPLTPHLRRIYYEKRRTIAVRISELRARLEGSEVAKGPLRPEVEDLT